MVFLLNMLLFSIILNMNLFSCFCSKPPSPKPELDIKSPHYKQISEHLNEKEIHMLKLIYQDLAFRDDYKKLTNTNFLLFFNLKGLWGTKLFQKFDQEKNSLISCDQFLLGMSKNLLNEARTAKATYQQKIKMLFSFLAEEGEDGIKFKQFIKMLYNYSKEELKQILLEDGVLVEEMLVNTPICEDKEKKLSIIQVDYLQKHKEVSNECANLYEKAFKQLISEYKDPGTCIQFMKDNQQYRLKYCNMISLVREFAQRIYKKYNVNQKTGRLNYEQFKQWISGNMKLFYSYYSAFHRNVWQYFQQTPDYLAEKKVELKMHGKLLFKQQLKNVLAMHVSDTILFCQSEKKMDYPFKVICLEGLNINSVNDKIGFGIEINHISSYYDRSVLYFQKMSERDQWIEHLKIYQGDSLQKKYIIGEAIGTGKFSIVYKCKDRQTGQNYALKVIQTEKLDQKALSSIKKQSEIMKIVNHPQIIKYRQTIITKGYIYIITELVYGEDLFQYVKKKKHLSQVQSAFIIGLILNAVVYLHNMQILHRDLKPQNILVVFKKKYREKLTSIKNYSMIEDYSPIETIKIIDFGFADHLSILKSENSQRMVNGTPHYLSPQVLLGKSYSQKSDSFAIGSILYFLLRGRHTFHASTQEQVLLKTVKGDYNIEDDQWNKISDQAKDLVKSLLQKNPHNRINLEEAQNHKWFNKMPWNQYQQDSINEQDIIIKNINEEQQKQDQKRRSQAETNSQSEKIQLPFKKNLSAL